MDTRQMVDVIRDIEYWHAPFRFGNLRENGIENIEQILESEAHYTINRRGYAPYAIILNEAPPIRYRHKVNGQAVWIPHENRHFMWHDIAFHNGVTALAMQIGAEVIF